MDSSEDSLKKCGNCDPHNAYYMEEKIYGKKQAMVTHATDWMYHVHSHF